MGTEGKAVVSPVLVWIKVNADVSVCMCAFVGVCVHVSARCHLSGLWAEVLQDVRRLFITEAFK